MHDFSVHLLLHFTRNAELRTATNPYPSAMKPIALLFTLLLAGPMAGQSHPGQDTANANPHFDQALAERLGADDYGMKNYFLVMLKTGTDTTADRQQVAAHFRGHLDNINRLIEEGKLLVAGPFSNNGNHYRGLFILDRIGSKEEAVHLLRTDPAIRAGLLDFELYDWYGSAALPEYLPAADSIWKQKP